MMNQALHEIESAVSARAPASAGPDPVAGEAATWSRVIRILLGAGLISTRELYSARIEVTPLSGRNSNAMVSIDKQARYVVRMSPEDPDVLTPSAEAGLLAHLRDEHGLSAVLPRCAYSSDAERCFVLDYVQHSRNLRMYWARGHRLPAFHASRLGTVLAVLHGSQPKAASGWRAVRPSVLKLRRPKASNYLDSSPAVLRTIGLLQGSAPLQQALAQLDDGWQATHLCHNDIRSENLLLTRSAPSARVSGLVLIDWELAGMGDPAWDLAGVFSEYAGYFIDSIPTSSHFPPGRFMAWAQFGPQQVSAAAQRFWHAYSSGIAHGAGEEQAASVLRKALGLVPARLVQTAFERAQRKSSLELANGMLLQLAENMACDPRASAAIFGFADSLGARPS